MKKPKIPKEVTDIALELGIELLRILKDLNNKRNLKLPRKKTKKGVKVNDDTTDITERVR